MPIKSLQQNVTSLREGLNQIGTIRKGAPKEPNKPGADLPYFRIVLNDQYQHLQSIVDETFNDEKGNPPEYFIGAHVIEDTADKAFSFWMEEWGKGGTLYHRCDGEQQHQHYSGHGYSFAKVACTAGNEAKPCACQRIGRLALWFEPLVAATGEFGYFTVMTSSKNDIVTVQQQLGVAEYMAARAGLSLMAVPFIFGRYEKAISSPAFKKQKGQWVPTGGRTMVTKSLFSLRPDPSWNIKTLLPAINQAGFLPPPSDTPQSELRLADAVKQRALMPPVRRLNTGVNDVEGAIGGTNGFKELAAKQEQEPEVTPQQTAQEMIPPDDVPIEDDEVVEGVINENEQAPDIAQEDEPAIIETTHAAKVKYIAYGSNAYLLFDGAHQTRCYSRKDFLKMIGGLADWKAFLDELTPGPAEQEAVDLPAPIVITAEGKTKDDGSTYWLVMDATVTAPESEEAA